MWVCWAGKISLEELHDYLEKAYVDEAKSRSASRIDDDIKEHHLPTREQSSVAVDEHRIPETRAGGTQNGNRQGGTSQQLQGTNQMLQRENMQLQVAAQQLEAQLMELQAAAMGIERAMVDGQPAAEGPYSDQQLDIIGAVTQESPQSNRSGRDVDGVDDNDDDGGVRGSAKAGVRGGRYDAAMQAFEDADLNQDGVIDRQEWATAMARLTEREAAEAAQPKPSEEQVRGEARGAGKGADEEENEGNRGGRGGGGLAVIYLHICMYTHTHTHNT